MNTNKNRKKRKNIMIPLSISLMILSSIFSYIESTKIFRYPILLIAIVILFVGILKSSKKNIEIYKINWSDIVYLLYITFSMISSLVHGDLEMILGTGIMLLTYFVLKMVVYDKESASLIYPIIITSLILIVSPIFSGLSVEKYKGFFINPNSTGMVSVTLLSMLIIYMNDEITTFSSRKWKYFLFFLVFSSIVFVILSSSRTSFIAMVSILIIMGFYKVRNTTWTTKGINKLFLGVITITVIFFMFNLDELISVSIIEKFVSKKDNLLDGRVDVWKTTIIEMRNFGYGRSYFDSIGLGAHNTFISILGQFGILAAAMFLFFVTSIVIKAAYEFIFLKKNKAFPTLLFGVVFLVLSMAEGVILSAIMFLFMNSINEFEKTDEVRK